MKLYMDIKPLPNTELELHELWKHKLITNLLIARGKRIMFAEPYSWVHASNRPCSVCHELTTGCCDTSDNEREM
jgi:hypothetical protein